MICNYNKTNKNVFIKIENYFKKDKKRNKRSIQNKRKIRKLIYIRG